MTAQWNCLKSLIELIIMKIFKIIINDSAQIALLLTAILMIFLLFYSITVFDIEIFNLIVLTFFLWGWSFIMFWLSAVLTGFLSRPFKSVPILSFFICILTGTVLGLINLKFGELFFNWDLYLNVFVGLGVFGGFLVFYFQMKLMTKRKEHINLN